MVRFAVVNPNFQDQKYVEIDGRFEPFTPGKPGNNNNAVYVSFSESFDCVSYLCDRENYALVLHGCYYPVVSIMDIDEERMKVILHIYESEENRRKGKEKYVTIDISQEDTLVFSSTGKLFIIFSFNFIILIIFFSASPLHSAIRK